MNRCAGVPIGWKVKLLKYVTTHIGSGKTPTGGAEVYQDDGVLFLRSQNVHDSGLRLDDAAFISEAVDDEMSGSRVQPRDVLLNITGASIGRCCVAPDDLPRANVNQHVCVIRPDPSLPPEWLSATLTSCHGQAQIDVAQTGAGREGLNFEQIGNMEVFLPPAGELQQLLRRIDRETARIDALIEKKTRFIELLREKRMAAITQTITCGIDAKVQTKASGIDWLGSIPTHWRITPMKYLGDTIIGLTYAPEEVAPEGEGTLVLRASNIQNGLLTFDDNVFVGALIPDHLHTQVGDLLICSRSGSRDLIGKCALINASAAGHSFGAFTTVFRSAQSRFLYYVLRSSLFAYQAGRFLTTTINQLTTETLKSFEVALPPPDEQHQICDFLDQVLQRIDATGAATARSIDLLKERRAALITAAVTGQIDVRAEQPTAVLEPA